MQTPEPSANSDTSRDDLQAIGDIGPQTAEALYRIGIKRYSDLARYTPEQLKQALQEQAHVRISTRRIINKDWIGQAMVLAELSVSRAQASYRAAETVHVYRQYAGFSLFFDRKQTQSGESEWQTRIYHDESGEEAVFEGIQAQQWLAWIQERTQLPIEPAPSPEPPQARPQIRIIDVQVSKTVALPGAPEGHLVAEISFELQGEGYQSLQAERQRYQIELVLVDIEHGTRIEIASLQGRLAENQRVYRRRQEFRQPGPGIYELHCSIVLLKQADLKHEYKGPQIRIPVVSQRRREVMA
jgi:Uncharacterized conserved protein